MPELSEHEECPQCLLRLAHITQHFWHIESCVCTGEHRGVILQGFTGDRAGQNAQNQHGCEEEDGDDYAFQKFRIFYVFFFSYYMFLNDEVSVVREHRDQGRGAAAFRVGASATCNVAR